MLATLALAASLATAQADLDAAKARWAQAGLTDYGYTVRRHCFCPDSGDPYALHVRNGQPVNPQPTTASDDTVPELFDRVQRAIDQDPEELTATYHPNGALATFAVDVSAYIVDEEFGLTVTEPVAETGPPPPETVTISRRGRRLSVPALDGARFQWLRNGKVIAGATRRNYWFKRADLRKRLRCRVVLASGSVLTTTAVTPTRLRA